MALAVIETQPNFIDRKFISELSDTGALATLANPTDIGLEGNSVQTIDFGGEMGIFGEGSTAATAAEKKKASNDATNGVVTLNPITYYISYRFPKKFLAVNGVDGYTPTSDVFRAGMPGTLFGNIMQQPYQAGVLEQYRAKVNVAVTRALDYSAFFGVNPNTKAASPLARTNGYLADTATVQAVGEGDSPRNAAFRAAVRKTALNGDTSAEAAISPVFSANMGDEVTGIGTPAGFAGSVPLIGKMFNLGGIPVTSTSILMDDTAATAGGITDNVEAFIGNFRERFVWGATTLSGIEVFDTGNPDNSAEGDLGGVNKVMLRTEIAMGWAFIGGADKFVAVTSPKVTPEP